MADLITVYFATNRMPITDATRSRIVDFGSELGPIDGTAIRFGSAQVRITRGKPQILRDSLYVADEQLYGPAGEEPQFGSRDIFDKIRQDMAEGGRPTLVVIHGFSNTFVDAIERAALILSFYGIDANVFAFTWPSRGSAGPIPLPIVDYVHDRNTAKRSGIAAARALRILYDYMDRLNFEEYCRQPLHLIAHSMGAYMLRHLLQALMLLPPRSEEPGAEPAVLTAIQTEQPDPDRLRQTFEQIVIAAGDEDDDAFEDPREMRYLPRIGRAVTVYHTERDWILSTLSRYTKFNGPRLGVNGPDNMATISDKVTAVDVTDVIDWTQDIQSHQYYRIFPAVRDDIVAVLSGTRPDDVPRRVQTEPHRYRIVRASGSRRRTARRVA